MKLSEDIPGELMNGVVLCHLINIVRPHAVSTIYLPAGSVSSKTYRTLEEISSKAAAFITLVEFDKVSYTSFLY